MSEKPTETLQEIIAEMRAHERGTAQEAWYTPKAWRELCDRLEAASKARRNCDIGTAREQVARFLEICRYQNCSECSFKGDSDEAQLDCFSRWQLMPYKPWEGGGAE